MDAKLTVYFNTGFSLNGDIPALPSVLNAARKKEYPNVYYVREDIDKPMIRVADTYAELCDVDYAKIDRYENSVVVKTSYFFAYPKALNQGVTVLELSLDALLTMGGAANLNYTSGWQIRGHVKKSEDTLFGNISGENWSPSKPLTVSGLQELNNNSQKSNIDVILSATDLVLVGGGDQIEVIVGEDVSSNPVMYFPKIQSNKPVDSTFFGIWDYQEPNLDPLVPPGAPRVFSTPGTCAFDASNIAIHEALTKLYSAGQLQLQASYRIPGRYIGDRTVVEEDSQNNPTGRYSRIDGSYDEIPAANCPYEYTIPGYTIKNKKCLTTYREYVIVNLGSGDMNIKPVYKIYDRENPGTVPIIKVWADPTSTGKPYARFGYIIDSPLQWSDTVKGLQWSNSQLLLDGASGSMWNSLNSAFMSQSLNRSSAMEELNRQREANLSKAQFNADIENTMANLEYATGAGKYGLTSQLGRPIQAGSATAQINNALDLLHGLSFLAGSAGKAMEYYTDAYDRQKTEDDALRTLQQLKQKQQINNDYYVASTGLQLAASRQAVNENTANLIRQNLVAPTIMFSPEQNLGLYGYNRFIVYEIRKTDEDVKSEDMFYQRYGYSGLNRPLTKECFDTRQYYTYVQAADVNIKSNFGLRVRQKAIAQLNAGVRVWKVLPDVSYYETN